MDDMKKALGFVGIFGNIICIVVLGSILFVIHKTLKNNPVSNIHDQRFNWYLFFLAISDLIFSVFITINSYINLLDYSRYFCYSIDFIFESLNLYGIFLNLILSIDRYVSVKKPIEHKIKEFITQKYPKSIALITIGVAFAIISLSFIGNIPKYDPNKKSPELKCNSESSKFTVITIILIMIMLIVSVSLNIASWCFLCNYNRESRPKESLELIKRKSEVESRATSCVPLTAVSPNRSSSTNSTISHSIVISRVKFGGAAKKQRPPNPYHLVLIAVNVIDFPFYLTFLSDYFGINVANKDIAHTITSFSIMLGHSINVMIYLLFHKRFRVMFSKPFCMIIQSICNGKCNEATIKQRESQTEELRMSESKKPAKQTKPFTRIIVI